MGHGRVYEPEFSQLDMTPMIDVVFQLVIFLMVANDMTRREIEDLALPRADEATEDRAVDARLIVNLLAAPSAGPPSLVVRGRALDVAGLEASLRDLAATRREGCQPSVLVRADRDCPWRHVQLVLQACAGREIAIHRVEFAAVATAGGAR